MSEVLRVDPDRPEPAAIARAAALLSRGELVALPTETVYGLAANAFDSQAVERIFAAKGRPAINPLIVHVASAEAARELAGEWPATAARLAERFWPGPLTLVVPKRSHIPDSVTAGLSTVALRVPSHPVTLAVLRAVDFPLAAPSANRSGQLSPTTAAHVQVALGERVSLILDAGKTEVGIESAVVDLSGPVPVLLRPGMLSRAEIEAVTGPLAAAGKEQAGVAPRPSPGMLERHYAPHAALRILTREALVAAARSATAHTSALLFEPLPDEQLDAIPMPREPRAYAQRLYSTLHQLDARGSTLILVEALPDTPEWAALSDRLTRAAHE